MLADYLDKDRILLNVTAKKYRDMLLHMLETSGEQDKLCVVDNILEREKIMPTAIGKGIFLPRAVLKEKSKSEVIIATNPSGLSFEDYGPMQAYIIVLFLFSENDDSAAILAQTLRLLSDDTLRSDILESVAPIDVIKAISEWEEE
jgi:mannitol/fructose-specific phosphotransferase system IIA component (Ntr-type)